MSSTGSEEGIEAAIIRDMPVVLTCLDIGAVPPPTNEVILTNLQRIRTAVNCVDPEPILDALLAANGIALIQPHLASADSAIVLEATWVLTNVASSTSEHCRALVDANLISALIGLLAHPAVDVIEQAIWALGNIAGDCVAYRDGLLRDGLAPKLCAAFARADASRTFKGNVCWTISNLCRGKPRPRDDDVRPFYALFHSILRDADCATLLSGTTNEWFANVLWAISYLSDGSDDNIQEVLKHGLLQEVLRLYRTDLAAPGLGDSEVIPRRIACEQLGDVFEYVPQPDLIRLATVSKDVFETTMLDNRTLYNRLRFQFVVTSRNLRVPTIRILGNVVSGNDEQTEQVIACGGLDIIAALLSGDEVQRRESEMKEIMWCLSNVMAGTRRQVNAVVDRPILRDSVEKCLLSHMVWVTDCALWCVSNLLSTGLKSLSFGVVQQWVLPAIAVYRFGRRLPNSAILSTDGVGAHRGIVEVLIGGTPDTLLECLAERLRAEGGTSAARRQFVWALLPTRSSASAARGGTANEATFLKARGLILGLGSGDAVAGLKSYYAEIEDVLLGRDSAVDGPLTAEERTAAIGVGTPCPFAPTDIVGYMLRSMGMGAEDGASN